VRQFWVCGMRVGWEGPGAIPACPCVPVVAQPCPFSRWGLDIGVEKVVRAAAALR